ncbi:hypothetical protein WH50_18325 [Pokkaliibacter plantistimulans]|uniref:Uncharacterized protein n=1 Tax=Pokkaliibacter plantistimulans TaxID=1635171 RepID=A0ABX5LUT6_9GAMM|nr:hypothetical protein [Pokkaliibacter plantistimulans]PXF29909.1 hypothetical protein WH50_18325 [Pokkaliibacter plantistimulans]
MKSKLVSLCIALILFLLALVQGYFIYAVQHGFGTSLNQAWNSFGVSQSGYSQFVFNTIAWWWILPVLCLVFVLSAFRVRKKRYRAFMVAFGLFGTIALYASAYAPSLFITI